MNADAVATPPVLVVAVVVAEPLAKVPLAPLDGAVKVTVALGTTLPEASLTVACSAVAKAVDTVADCPPPAVTVIDAGGPAGAAAFVRLKVAAAAMPLTEAVTLYEPAVALAVNTEAVATPLPFVLAVVVAVLLAKVPLAPLDGAAKVTTTLGTKLPDASLTVACRDMEKAVFTVADWLPPTVAEMDAGVPILVRANEALALTPLTEAVTE